MVFWKITTVAASANLTKSLANIPGFQFFSLYLAKKRYFLKKACFLNYI